MPGRRRFGRSAADRVRRAQCGRGPDRAAGARGRRTARRHEDRRGQDARRAILGHAVLGARAGPVAGPCRPARTAGRVAPGHRYPRRAGSGRHLVHAQADAQSRRLPVHSRCGPRSRRADRHAAHGAGGRARAGHDRPSPAGRHPGPGSVRPLCRARDPGRQRARRDARMDEDAPGACRPAFGVGPGRYFQLRHARGGASLACVRSRQDRRRSLRALGARRRNARTAQRPGRRAGPQGGRGGGRRTGGEPGRHHGRRSDLGDAGYAQHLPRGGILVARRDRRPRAPLQVQLRSQPPLRARRGLRLDPRAHRTDHPAHSRHLRRTGRPGRRPVRQPARARARAHAAGALPPCAGRGGGACRSGADLHPPGPAVPGAGRRLRRDAAVVPFRHRDRGRPDRGSRARLRLRADSRRAAGGARQDARAARSAPRRARRAPPGGRARLPGSGQLQLRRSRVGT
ncbi:Uncharacterised protein [Bordetella pertussis]|nr:Uncharacterised protein [Bordetella pertussis]